MKRFCNPISICSHLPVKTALADHHQVLLAKLFPRGDLDYRNPRWGIGLLRCPVGQHVVLGTPLEVRHTLGLPKTKSKQQATGLVSSTGNSRCSKGCAEGRYTASSLHLEATLTACARKVLHVENANVPVGRSIKSGSSASRIGRLGISMPVLPRSRYHRHHTTPHLQGLLVE